MKRISKSFREMPELNTSSLPDLIFTLLFFFMITTSPRQADLKVNITPPKASELSRIEKKSLVTYIHLGQSDNATEWGGGKYALQINDRIVSIDDVKPYLEKERQRLPIKDRDQMIVSLHVDETAPMGLVTDVKLKMREADALLVSYAATTPPK